MLFSKGQLRSTFSLSKQQWRSYRETLPPLAKGRGRSDCFTATDMLATGVVHRLSSSLSMPLSAFTDIAAPLFELCAANPWPQLERSSLMIDIDTPQVQRVDQERRGSFAAVALIIELAPLVMELRQHLLAGVPDLQQDLAFPPMIARKRQ